MSNAWSSRRGRRRVAVTPPESCILKCTDRDSERLSSPQTTCRSLMVQVLFLCRSPRIILTLTLCTISPARPHPPYPKYDTLTPLLLQKILTIVWPFTYFLRTKFSTCCSTLHPPSLLSALWIRDAFGQDRHKGAPSARLWGRRLVLFAFLEWGEGLFALDFSFPANGLFFASTCLSSSSSSRYDGNLQWTGIWPSPTPFSMCMQWLARGMGGIVVYKSRIWPWVRTEGPPT